VAPVKEQGIIIFLNVIRQINYKIDIGYVFLEARAKLLYIIEISFTLQRVNVMSRYSKPICEIF
jgi:hypothetical protein